jgi:hypothetical protein
VSAVSISLNPGRIEVMPGSKAQLSVEVRNLGNVVDRYRLELLGIDPGWYTVAPVSLELFPQREGGEMARPGGDPPSVGRFTVSIHPPRTSDAVAGEWALGAKVWSENNERDRVVEEATLVLLPFGALEADLRPAVAGGRLGATTHVRIANRGGRSERLGIAATDSAERIDFKIDVPFVELAPGAATAVRVRMSGDIAFVGGTDSRPFTIDVRPVGTDTQPISLRGVYDRRALVPAGVPVSAAVLAALFLGAVATGLIKIPGGDGGDPSASAASASPTVVVTPSPIITPTITAAVTPVITPPVTPIALSCGGQTQVVDDLRLNASQPSFSDSRDLCVVRMILFTDSAGSGPVVIRAGDATVLTFDMADYDGVGTEGGGSGEREVTFSPPFPIPDHTTVVRDISGCSGDGCNHLLVTLEVAQAA